jgi:hypothetical protein
MSTRKFPCWVCGNPLQCNSAGELIFAIYIDPVGNEHKTHKFCRCTIEPQVTADVQEDYFRGYNYQTVDGDQE